MKIIVDRFEEKYAIVELEDRTVVEMSRRLLPHGAREGDVIEILIDSQATEQRRLKMQEMMDRLSGEKK